MTADITKELLPGRAAPVLFTEETDSTNNELKRMASEARSGTVLISARQTAGKGRSGRSFISNEGGLYYSMLLKFAEPDERLLNATPLTAVAVVRTLQSFGVNGAEIKWPNDILLGGKKLCGILTECVTDKDGMKLIVGIGINVNTDSFPEDIAQIACSVKSVTGKSLNVRRMGMELTRQLDRVFEALPEYAPEDLAQYRNLCGTIGKKISVGGVAVRIEDDFSLTARMPDGSEKRIFFGEIFHTEN